MTTLRAWAAAAAILLTSGAAQASLVDRGGGMIYDTTQNVTWLANLNYAQTSGYDSDGKMTWSQATAWASQLSYGGFDDWAMASISQLVHLFQTDLGNQAGTSILDTTGDSAEQIANLGLFNNVISGVYWSSSEQTSSRAYIFLTKTGAKSDDPKAGSTYAVAMRAGDVGATTPSGVPEPQTLALVMAALAAAAATYRGRRAAA